MLKIFLKKLEVDTFNSLVDAIALYRPGPREMIDEYISTAYRVRGDSGNVFFQYWSYDPEGNTVASIDISYAHRVTTDADLYAGAADLPVPPFSTFTNAGE